MTATEDKDRQIFTPFQIISQNSPFRFYRTVTSFASKELHPVSFVLKDTPYLLLPSDNSYAIYDLQSLRLQFLGPAFSPIRCIMHSGAFTYVCADGVVYRTVRGEIVATGSIPGVDVEKILVFGATFLVQAERELVVCECVDDSENGNFLVEEKRVRFGCKVKHVFHPHGYSNKIIVFLEDGTAQLYNVNTDKKIFEFVLGDVATVAQTSVADVIGLAMEDGTVKIYNVKKDKLVFEITDYVGKRIRRIDFKDRMAVIITEDLAVYDLEIKREIYRRQDVYSGMMINSEILLITTGCSADLLTLSDMDTLKSRRILNEGIVRLVEYGHNELIMVSEKRAYKLNIYRDEIGRFLKNKEPIEWLDADQNTVEAQAPNILMFGERKLSYIDGSGKYHEFITQKCRFSRIFRDFCIFGTSTKIVVMNIKSKRVILTHPLPSDEETIDGCLDNSFFTVLTSKRLTKYNLKCEVMFEYPVKNEIKTGSLRRCQDLYFILDSERTILTVVSSENVSSAGEALTREFPLSKFSLDPACKVIVGIHEKDVFIYDIMTGSLIEKISTSVELADVAVLDGFKFIALLDARSGVHLLSNLAHFGASHGSTVTGVAAGLTNIPVVKKESSFYKELVLYKSFAAADHDLVLRGLTKEEVKELLELITNNIEKDFFNSQKLLNRLLLYKSRLIEPCDISKIKAVVNRKLAEIEENVLRSVGELRLSDSRM